MITTVIAFLTKQAVGLGIPDEFGKPAAIGFLVLCACGMALGAKSAYDSELVQSALIEARAQFLEDKDEATGDADEEFGKSQDKLEEELKTTEEIIDDALKNGCPVGESLARGDGAYCV